MRSESAPWCLEGPHILRKRQLPKVLQATYTQGDAIFLKKIPAGKTRKRWGKISFPPPQPTNPPSLKSPLCATRISDDDQHVINCVEEEEEAEENKKKGSLPLFLLTQIFPCSPLQFFSLFTARASRSTYTWLSCCSFSYLCILTFLDTSLVCSIMGWNWHTGREMAEENIVVQKVPTV